MLKEGDHIPNFSLLADNEECYSHNNLINHTTVLYFYPKDNTPGCTNEAQDFNHLLLEFAKYNTQIIGISKDDVGTHKTFKDKYNLNFPLLSDPTLEVHKKFGAYGQKISFGKSYEGPIRSTFIISSELKILYAKTKVVVKDHANFILNKIKGLLNS